MTWATYPERDYQRLNRFGVYLDPREGDNKWGLRVHGLGHFSSKDKDIRSGGRVLEMYALVIVLEGGGSLLDWDGGETLLEAGDVVSVVPGWRHIYNPNEQTGWRTAWVLFDGPVAEALHQAGDLTAGKLTSNLGDTGLQSLGAIVDGMIRLAMSRPDSKELQARLAGELLGLLAKLADWSGQQALSAGKDSISTAIEQIEETFTEVIDFVAIIDKSGMSATHFRREFKTITGEGLQTYQQRLRMRMAKELLRHSELSVSEIGVRVGYPTLAYFSRVFSKRVGMSPRVWRSSSL